MTLAPLRDLLRRSWPTLAAALPALVLLGLCLRYYGDFVSDDAFISFRYAEHLATGRGLEWNPGERVEGYTNFLWVVLMAALRVLQIPVPAAARLLSWASAALTVLLIVALGRRASTRPSWALLVLAPLPLLLSFSYQYWTALRLETPFFAALLLLGVYLFLREDEQPAGQRWPSALAYLALALTRPEGAAFIAVPGLALLLRLRSLADLRQELRRRAVWLGIYFGGFALYTLWRVLYFGDLFPNTYYAKVGGDTLLRMGWEYVLRFAPRPDVLLLLVAVLLLGGLAVRSVRLIVAEVLLLALLVILEGGCWMREFRLLVPLIPLLVAALAVSLQRLVAERTWIHRVPSVIGVLLLCAWIQWLFGTPLAEWRQALRGVTRDQLINLEGEMTRASADVGAWLRREARPGALVAVNHAGAVPFYSGLPSLDMAGLNDRHIARLPGMRHRKWDPAYVLGRRPAFVVLNSVHPPDGGRYVPGYWDGETALFQHPEFQRCYRMEAKSWRWRHRAIELRETPHVGFKYIMVFRRTCVT